MKNEVSGSNIRFTSIPAFASFLFLIFAYINFPAVYYDILRIVVIASALYYIYYFFTLKKYSYWIWFLISILILFNPLIYFSKYTWIFIDVVAAFLFICLTATLSPLFKKYFFVLIVAALICGAFVLFMFYVKPKLDAEKYKKCVKLCEPIETVCWNIEVDLAAAETKYLFESKYLHKQSWEYSEQRSQIEKIGKDEKECNGRKRECVEKCKL
jgi:glucan phosphoethanolaminetransferase (alkaline phosphatase superfamily)